MHRVVITDAGPLIGLARIDQLDLLMGLFGQVAVTTQVADELLCGGDFPDTTRLAQALAGPWMQQVKLSDEQIGLCRDWINLYQIDMGEASAMVLAQQGLADGTQALLIMDDYRGRSAAQHARLALIGTVGLLLLAKQAGAIPTVKPHLLALRRQGYFLSQSLMDIALNQAAE